MELNHEVCEFIGAFIGDGYLSISKVNQKTQIGIIGQQPHDEEYLTNHLYSIIERNFPFTKPHIYYRKDENTVRIHVYNKVLGEFLCSLGFKPGLKSRTVKIPERIIGNEDFLNATVRGIFDSDGCIFWDKRQDIRDLIHE